MGKLLGVPHGADACYTNHARADQNDCENLAVLLAVAGCKLLHGRADGRRRDALLSIHQLPRRGRIALGVEAASRARVRAMVRASGNSARRPSHRPRRRRTNRNGPSIEKDRARRKHRFDRDAAKSTPARLGLGRAGPRYTTAAMLLSARRSRARRRRGHGRWSSAIGRGATACSRFIRKRSRAKTTSAIPSAAVASPMRTQKRIAHLKRRGKSATPTVLICVGDGLSSAAVEKNAAPLLRALTKMLASRYRLLKPIFIRNARGQNRGSSRRNICAPTSSA